MSGRTRRSCWPAAATRSGSTTTWSSATGPRSPPGRLIEGDLLTGRKVEPVLREKRIDAVMHFAAFAYVGESVTDPAKYYRNNVVGTLSLMEAMRAAGVSRIVFSSTCATYGEPEEDPDPREPAAAADQPLRVHQAGDRARPGRLCPRLRLGIRGPPLLQRGRRLGRRRHRRGPRPRDPPDPPGAPGRRSASGTHITIFGDELPTPDGTCIRDYIHVDDLATAHLAALDAAGAGHRAEAQPGHGRRDRASARSSRPAAR